VLPSALASALTLASAPPPLPLLLEPPPDPLPESTPEPELLFDPPPLLLELELPPELLPELLLLELEAVPASQGSPESPGCSPPSAGSLESETPLGVPTPVGPSQPGPATHCTLVQAFVGSLVPLVMSLNAALWV
jgi:hypothetical protein